MSLFSELDVNVVTLKVRNVGIGASPKKIRYGLDSGVLLIYLVPER